MRIVATSLLVLMLVSCRTVLPASSTTCLKGERALTVDTLYFGMGRVAAPEVSDDEWMRFLGSIVTPRFPDGLTWWNAAGQWRGAAGSVVSESSFVLQVAHEPTREEEGKVQAIRDAYRKDFAQEAVMRARQPLVCVSFQ